MEAHVLFSSIPSSSSESTPRNTEAISSSEETIEKSSFPTAPSVVIERMLMSGFVNIAKNMHKIYPHGQVTLLVNGKPYQPLVHEWHNMVQSNPVFSYSNEYWPGWHREVCIRMGGKTRGHVDTSYVAPNHNKRIKNKNDLAAYLSSGQHAGWTADDMRLDFRHPHCICHDQTSSGQFVECSYGMAGCNGWVHPECIGIGVVSEDSLAALPPLVCPLCTYYLEGSGFHHVLDGKRPIYAGACKPRPTLLRVGQHIISESAAPHTTWGLEQTAVRYNSTIPLASPQSDAFAKEGFFMQSSSVVAPSSSLEFDNLQKQTNFPAQEAKKTIRPLKKVETSQKAASSPTRSLSTAASLFKEKSSSRSSAGLGKSTHGGLFDHVLFNFAPSTVGDSDATPGGNSGEIAGESIISDSLLPKEFIYNSWDFSIPTGDELNGVDTEDDSVDDEDSGNPPQGQTTKSNFRYAQHDDRRMMVRIDGGWMAAEDASLGNEVFQVIPNRKQVLGASAREAIRGRIGEKKHFDEELISGLSIMSMSKQKEEHCETFMPMLDQKYSKMLIEPVLSLKIPHSASHSGSKRKATSFTSSVEMSQSVMHAGESLAQQLPPGCEVTNPVLCPFPLQDGGVRIVCAVPGSIPRSLHQMCTSQVLCGYCLQAALPTNSLSAEIDNFELIADVAVNPKLEKKKSKAGKATTPDWEPDSGEVVSKALQLVEVKVGSVVYAIHSMCHYALGLPMNTLLDIEGMTGGECAIIHRSVKYLIEIGSMYEYDQAEDADCDLCGRMGGILFFYSLSNKCSKLSPPSEEGWIAHVPCIYWLVHSGLVREIVFPNELKGAEEKDVASSVKAVDEQASIEEQRDDLAPKEKDVAPSVKAVDEQASIEEQRNDLAANVGGGDNCEVLDETIDGGQNIVPTKLNGVSETALELPFDTLFGNWRCSICGLQTGICIRCSAVGCGARAHALCALQTADFCSFDDQWHLTSISISRIIETGGAELSTVCLTCPLHSVRK